SNSMAVSPCSILGRGTEERDEAPRPLVGVLQFDPLGRNARGPGARAPLRFQRDSPWRQPSMPRRATHGPRPDVLRACARRAQARTSGGAAAARVLEQWRIAGAL